jgi:hypothetical protein
MCYNDHGPDGWRYSESYCGSYQLDCGKNDYWHATATTGYVGTSWNPGTSLNHFLWTEGVDFNDPTIELIEPKRGGVYLDCQLLIGTGLNVDPIVIGTKLCARVRVTDPGGVWRVGAKFEVFYQLQVWPVEQGSDDYAYQFSFSNTSTSGSIIVDAHDTTHHDPIRAFPVDTVRL